jgi:hypothetical protein
MRRDARQGFTNAPLAAAVSAGAPFHEALAMRDHRLDRLASWMVIGSPRVALWLARWRNPRALRC